MDYNCLDPCMGAIQHLLQAPEFTDRKQGFNSDMYSLIFSQLEKSLKLLKLLNPRETISDWHGLVYEELYRVVTRIRNFVEYSEVQSLDSERPPKRGRNYSSSGGHISMIPAEARGEHLLETLLDLRWWMWVVAFQVVTYRARPTLYDDHFGPFEGVLCQAEVSGGDSITRRSLPSYGFERWQQNIFETDRGQLKEMLLFRSEGNNMLSNEMNVLLTKIWKADSPVFVIKALRPRAIQGAGRPSSIQDYLEIDLTQDLLGASSTGYVIRTTCGQEEFCALKRINTDDEEPPDLARLWHPHVVHLKHYWREESDRHLHDGLIPKSRFMTFLVMELMHGDLGKLLKTIKKRSGVAPFSLPVAVDVMLQIAKGMLHLHDMGVSHPHLKCENVLCRIKNEDAVFRVGDVLVKLGGFGCSRTASVGTKNRDVFCFGLTCLEILTGDEWCEDVYGADSVTPRLAIPETTPPFLAYCIESCLDPKLTGANLTDAKLTFSEVVILLLLAQLQIMQTYKVTMILSSVSPHTEKVQDSAPSFSRSNDGFQEMFHVHQLHPHPHEIQTSVQITLIFFHGFPKVSEEWRMTWMARDNKLLWPQKWLPEDIGRDRVRVLSVSFDDRPNVSSDRIQLEISQHLLPKLVLGETWKLDEAKQVIFLVGHSFGGVIIKALVSEARKAAVTDHTIAYQDRKKCNKFLESLATVVFYSVPDALTSTEFESYLSGCSNTRVLQRSSLLKSLRGDDCFIPEMIRLSRDFVSAVPRETKVLVFCEGKPMSKSFFLVTESEFCKVKHLSLNWEWHKVDKDNHFEVCRPDSRSHIGYKFLLGHIQALLHDPVYGRVGSIFYRLQKVQAELATLRAQIVGQHAHLQQAHHLQKQCVGGFSPDQFMGMPPSESSTGPYFLAKEEGNSFPGNVGVHSDIAVDLGFKGIGDHPGEVQVKAGGPLCPPTNAQDVRQIQHAFGPPAKS